MGTQNQSRTYAVGLTLLSALGRLVPHVPNFTPVGSSCLFAGSRISGYLAYLLPLAVMIATDPFVGGYTFGSPLIYASFMLSVWIGRQLLKKEVSVARVGGAALLCSTQFFLISNFGVWLAASRSLHPYYAPNVAGLIECYVSAIPYWGYTVAGDLFYSAAIFGLYAFLTRRVSQTAEHAAA
ncbi:MAG TPA: DUF6580 family putative transport protein [Bryobacteraceae bacterium]|jgi:hypothetical protein